VWPAPRCPEAANLSHPEAVREVAEAFLDAGAEVLETNTAVANAMALADEIARGEVREADLTAMNQAGAAVCRAAVSGFPLKGRLVVGAMGPGERLLLLKEVEEEALYQAYAAQARALAAGGADAILCRSFREMDALCLAVRAAAETTSLPVIGSMVFDCGPDRTETTLGVTAPQACAALREAGAWAVGCNCGQSPDSAAAVLTLMRQCWEGPIWVKIHPGLPQVDEGKVVYPESPEAFAARLPVLAAAGANFVGGCCGASVEHIAALVASRRGLGLV
jgi:methionine synthase I (cobalamin-dependent)